MLAVLVGVPTWRRRDREQLARARDLVDYLGPRRLRRPLRRHAVDRHPPHLRAGVHPRPRAPGHLPRRADRRRRPARDRGVRPAHHPHPGRARRVAARHRARHAVRDVDQRPRVLPRDRHDHRRGSARPGAPRPARRRARTSAPTSGRSSAPGAAARRRSVARRCRHATVAEPRSTATPEEPLMTATIRPVRAGDVTPRDRRGRRRRPAAAAAPRLHRRQGGLRRPLGLARRARLARRRPGPAGPRRRATTRLAPRTTASTCSRPTCWRLVDDLGWDRFVLLGHSMGGMVSQAIAIHHPDRLDGLVLMDTDPAVRSSGGGLTLLVFKAAGRRVRHEGDGALRAQAAAAVARVGAAPLRRAARLRRRRSRPRCWPPRR